MASQVKNVLKVLLALLLALPAVSSHAQKQPKKLKKAGVVQLNDSLTTYSQSDIFQFPNVGRIPFYYDAGKIKQLDKMNKAGAVNKEMYDALRDYVKAFGIETSARTRP